MSSKLIAKNIEILRIKKEMKQEEFAKKLNVSRPTVSNWEQGKALPTTDQLLRIAVFGVSCSGKDTFIDELLKSPVFKDFRQHKGSSELNELSQKQFSMKFSDLKSEDKNEIRELFAKTISQEENCIADGHFCFPDASYEKYEKVFTDFDLAAYDVFVYIKAEPINIKQRLESSEKNRKFAHFSEEQIKSWQNFEIEEMEEICFCDKKEFIVVDGDFHHDIQFLNQYVLSYPKYTATEIAKTIVSEMADSSKIALFDCDKTIVEEDTTIPFFKLNNFNEDELKKIFADDTYSQYQFWRQIKLYNDFKKYPEPSDFHPNSIVIEKLSSLKKQGFAAYGLTAGVLNICKDMNATLHLFDDVFGSDLSEELFLISKFVKGYVTQFLAEQEKEIISVGDSIFDIYMLENSTEGFIYAPQKLRKSVQQYIDLHPKTKIKQFSKNPFQYRGIISEE
ncbi:MAG: helix-turn-helix domain-containing protein [Treponema sp.]|nr:helix-turn-helix domain-containing protein [Treponema sp.]